MTDFKIKVTHMITQQQVADLVTTAFESGVTAEWLGTCEPRYTSHQDYSSAGSYGDDMIPRRFTVDGEDRNYIFDIISVKTGLSLMANKFTSDFDDLISNNGDAATADVFMQCALLADVVYG